MASRWFDLEEFAKVKTILSKFEKSIMSSRSTSIINQYIYLNGICDLKLAKNAKQENKAREAISHIKQIPRYRRLIKLQEYLTQIDKEGIDEFISKIDSQAGIIMSPDDYIAVSRVLNKKNLPEKALEVLENGLVFHENDSSMLYDAAMLAISLDIEDKMENYLRRIMKIDPDNFHAFNALGYTWADQNRNLPQAKEYIEKALSHQPLEPIILDSYGWYFYRVGNYQKALEFLNRALNLNHDPEIAAHLVEVLVEIDKSSQASGNERVQAEMVFNQAMSRYQQYPDKDASVRAIKIMNKVAHLLNKPEVLIK